MSKERLEFFTVILGQPPSQPVENLASECHETKRIPDPYIFVVDGNRLRTPSGLLVEDSIDRLTHLGAIEFQAFKSIQGWAARETSGIAIWASPPLEGHYPVSKIVISQISTHNGHKILFNRAVVLDIDAEALLDLANSCTPDFPVSDPEALRATPLFPDSGEFLRWLDKLSFVHSQVEAMLHGLDILWKQETYASVRDLSETVLVTGQDTFYTQLYESARQRGMIGKNQGSCPAISFTPFTPFEHLFAHSLEVTETKYLNCTCPFCQKKVRASISGGKIHCPECGKNATYKC